MNACSSTARDWNNCSWSNPANITSRGNPSGSPKSRRNIISDSETLPGRFRSMPFISSPILPWKYQGIIKFGQSDRKFIVRFIRVLFTAGIPKSLPFSRRYRNRQSCQSLPCYRLRITDIVNPVQHRERCLAWRHSAYCAWTFGLGKNKKFSGFTAFIVLLSIFPSLP